MDSIKYIQWASKQRIEELLRWIKYYPKSIYLSRRSEEIAELQKNIEQEKSSS